jgi:hypothetical protein
MIYSGVWTIVYRAWLSCSNDTSESVPVLSLRTQSLTRLYQWCYKVWTQLCQWHNRVWFWFSNDTAIVQLHQWYCRAWLSLCQWHNRVRLNCPNETAKSDSCVNAITKPDSVDSDTKEFDSVVSMTLQSLTQLCQWHWRIWLRRASDIAESDSTAEADSWVLSMTLLRLTQLYQSHKVSDTAASASDVSMALQSLTQLYLWRRVLYDFLYFVLTPLCVNHFADLIGWCQLKLLWVWF